MAALALNRLFITTGTVTVGKRKLDDEVPVIQIVRVDKFPCTVFVGLTVGGRCIISLALERGTHKADEFGYNKRGFPLAI